MALTIGATPDRTFDQPLGLMMDCHRRVERFLDQLLTVAEQVAGGPLSDLQREALDVALRYFREAAPLHTRDEEESLFPRLQAADDDRVRAALAEVAALEADHDTADAAHATIDRLGRQWLADGALPAPAAETLRAELQTLRELYRHHIAVEDERIYPLAGAVLDAEALRQVGREMAVRRGLDPDHLPPVSRCVSRREQRQG